MTFKERRYCSDQEKMFSRVLDKEETINICGEVEVQANAFLTLTPAVKTG
jgi:hypothetical protein